MKKQTKRRGRGEGAIYYREDRKCYVGSVSLGYDAEGRRLRKRVMGKTKREVQEQIAKLQVDASMGMVANAKGRTMKAFLHEWLETTIRPNRRINTYVDYEVVVRRHLVPYLGSVLLEKVTPGHIKALQIALEKGGASPSLRQRAHIVLRGALQEALRLGYIPRNPAAVLKRPAAPKKRFPVYDASEASRFLAAAESDRLYAVYVLALNTGMRQGEILGLQWEDINLDAGELYVKHTLIEAKGQLQLGEPKTSSGYRRIKLLSTSVRALEGHRRSMQAECRSIHQGYVFCDSKGGPIRKGNLLRRSYKPIIDRAGLKYVRFHDLRHTVATLLLAKGHNPKIIQELLGHSDIRVTLGTYSHVTPIMHEEAISTLDELFKRDRDAEDT